MPPNDGYQGTYWQAIQLPIAGGLRNRVDSRVRPSPFMDICQDAQFDISGGLQTRLPYDDLKGAIVGGGMLGSNVRKIVAYGDELVLFTSDTVYSWNDKLQAWSPRGTHLAVALTEKAVCATNGDQIDGDRAELNNTIVVTWTEGGKVYAAAMDKATGGMLAGPTALSTTVDRSRVVALATRILVFTAAGGNTLTVRSIDPAAPATGFAAAGTNVIAGTFNGYYDVVRAGTQDLCVGAARHTTTTSYTVFQVTGLGVTTAVVKARTSDGPLAVSTIATGTQTQVVRANGANIVGDLLTTSTLADVFTGTAIGTALLTPVNQIAAAHRSVQNGGGTRCYVFWSSGETATSFSTGWSTESNWVDTTNAVGGAKVTIAWFMGVGSRAFDFNGSVYLWLTFGQVSQFTGDVALPTVSQAQNAFVLYRDDGFFAAKACYNDGGGLRPTIGLLPGVASTGFDTYSWIGTARRRIVLNNGTTTFTARTPHDIVFTFDSNAARRCARLGRTLYIAGGEMLQFDGIRLTEVGFHFYPWSFQILKAGAGSIANGTYAYKITWRWTNAKGEVDRSTTATIGTATMTAGPAAFVGDLQQLNTTHKRQTDGAVAVEVWRTEVNQDEDTPFFLTTSPNPTVTTPPNRYLFLDPTGAFLPASIADGMVDATLKLQEPNPENGTILEDLCPPSAQIITATDTRIFIAGIAGDPDRVWYSKLREDGKIAAFHDSLIIDVPRLGGAITAVRVFEENLYVWRETALYRFPGVGLDNAGAGQNYGPAVIVSLDVGAVSDESVALIPAGMIFKSRKGWQAMGGNGQLTDISAWVSDYDGEDVLAIDVIETQRQVRVLTANRILMWDYDANQWGTWSISGGVSSCVYRGAHVYAASSGTHTQLAGYTNNMFYGKDVQLSWIKPANLTADAQNDRAPGGQGRGMTRTIQPLGELRSASGWLRIRVAYDYDETYVDDRTWKPEDGAFPRVLQVRHDPTRRRCEAFKVRITETGANNASEAILVAATDISVPTSSGQWAASWAATSAGEAGNRISMALAFDAGVTGSAPVIAVRKHFAWDQTAQRWLPALNCVGVRIVCDPAAPITVASLEAGILAGLSQSELDIISLTTPDPTPSAHVTISAMVGTTRIASFSGGAEGTPSTELVRLTGLGVEVGLEPGMYRRLPPAQQQ